MFPKTRFEKLLQYHHWNDSESEDQSNSSENRDLLYKIRPLLDALKQSFGDAYTPGEYLTVDEAMVAFRGRTKLLQYMKNKPVKWGFKIWLLADSKTYYILDLDVYCGKSDTKKNQLVATRVVTSLTSRYANTNRVVCTDNFYSSIPLFEQLLQMGIRAVGTMKTISI